eukprot:gb/GEZN01006151.1/.p1 GENE.gb/GEZN01006151.1/~~gb/GEZN01006151.1/.p1  ORF type:complete len:415 (-),score=41.60 gb/GEZN01006151.1/:146-1390(-)
MSGAGFDYAPVSEQVAPASRLLSPLRKAAGLMGVALVGGLGMASRRLFSQTAPEHSPEPFYPRFGFSAVLTKPGPPGIIGWGGGPACLFSYGEVSKKKDHELSDLITNSKASVRDGRVYGIRREQAQELAYPTGNKHDHLQGKLLCFAVVTFKDTLKKADDLHYYPSDHFSIVYNGPNVQRGTVAVVREDGSNAKAYWYFQKPPAAGSYPSSPPPPPHLSSVVPLLSVSAFPPSLSAPVFSLATLNDDGTTNMNILTYAQPVGLLPTRTWVISLFEKSLTHENFKNQHFGVLQLLRRKHAPLVAILGKQSGTEADKRAESAAVGFPWYPHLQQLTGKEVVLGGRDNALPDLLPGCAVYYTVRQKSDYVNAGEHDAVFCTMEKVFAEHGKMYDEHVSTGPEAVMYSGWLREHDLI